MLIIARLQTNFFPPQNIENEISTKLCACCWQVTKRFHVHFTKIQKLWDRESHNLKEIKIEMNLEHNEISPFLSNVFDAMDQVKLESSSQASGNCDTLSEENHCMAFDNVSQTGSIESDEPISKLRTKYKRTASKTTKPKVTKIPLKYKTVEEQTQKRAKLEIEDQQIREYFKMNCDVCEDHFETFLDIKNHYKDKHQSVGYLTCCGKKFIRRGACLSHISRHVNPDLFK